MAFFSGEDMMHEDRKILSNVQSLTQSPANRSSVSVVPETKSETSHHVNTAAPEVGPREEESAAASPVHADCSQQSSEITTTSRPTTPEAPRSSNNPPVTGHRSAQNNSVDVAHHPLGEDQQHANNGSEESGNPTQHYDDTENNGLLTVLQKVCHHLRSINILAYCILQNEMK